MKKTGTSATRAKARYNAKNYDDVCFRVGTGGNAYINYLAERVGKSKAEYIRSLIIADARKRGEENTALKIGGGGVIAYKNGLPVIIQAVSEQEHAHSQLLIEDINAKAEGIKKARNNMIKFLKNKYNVPPTHVEGMIKELLESFGAPLE